MRAKLVKMEFVKFSEIWPGEPFRTQDDDSLLIKLSRAVTDDYGKRFNAVRAWGGDLDVFEDEQQVIRIDGEFIERVGQ